MTTEIEALRASMKAAQVPGGGAYVEDGLHLLEVDNCFVKQTVKEGNVKTTYIAEFKVLDSNNPTHGVGTTRSYVENPQNDGWLGRWKGFLAAAIGADPTTITPDVEKQIGDIIVALRYDEERKRLGLPENFLKGRKVKCEGSAGLSKKGGKVTNKRWSATQA